MLTKATETWKPPRTAKIKGRFGGNATVPQVERSRATIPNNCHARGDPWTHGRASEGDHSRLAALGVPPLHESVKGFGRLPVLEGQLLSTNSLTT